MAPKKYRGEVGKPVQTERSYQINLAVAKANALKSYDDLKKRRIEQQKKMPKVMKLTEEYLKKFE